MSKSDSFTNKLTPSTTTRTRSSNRNVTHIDYNETSFFGNDKDRKLVSNKYTALSKPTVAFRQKSKGIATAKQPLANLQQFFDSWGATLSIDHTNAAEISKQIIDNCQSLKWTCVIETEVDQLKLPSQLNDDSISEFRLKLLGNHHLSIKRSCFIHNKKHPWGLFCGNQSLSKDNIIGIYLGSYIETEHDIFSSGYQLRQIDAKQGFGGPGYFGIHFANDPSLTYLYELRAYIDDETQPKPRKTNKKVNAKFDNYKLVATKHIWPGHEILVNYFEPGRYKREENALKQLLANKKIKAKQEAKKRKREMKPADKTKP